MCCEQLLKDVSFIKEKYDEIAKITGDNFNIFKLLGKERDELSHSKILTALLDPKGTHDCNGIFLKLFFEHFLQGKYNPKIDFNDCHVYKEHSIGEDGRLDIYIDSGDVRVVIENKINAGDGKGQLERYSNFLRGENDHLIYLTLNGRAATEGSHRGVEYIRLAYGKKDGDEIGDTKKDVNDKSVFAGSIIDWLKDCQKEVFNKPLVRETIEQYINLLKIITNQTRSNKMKDEIIKNITKTAADIIAAKEISRNISEAIKAVIILKFGELMLKSKVVTKFGLKPDFQDIQKWCLEDKYCGFSFKIPGWENFGIAFQFQGRDLDELRYGFADPIPDASLNTYLRQKAVELKYKSSIHWPLYGVMENYRNWWDDNFFQDLYSNPAAITKAFEEKIEDMMKIAESS